jgi:pimeloyl-ACP methyl ester carboxylesterase
MIERQSIEGAEPMLVFLHEGLGSLGQWRDFPRAVAEGTGHGALVYSRTGNGFSEVLRGKRDVRYMHDEALTVLPKLLAEEGIVDPILIGHSDGASIAIIHGKARGMVLMAPHVFVEDFGLSAIATTKTTYETTDLRARIARHHSDGDKTFYGWSDIWLDPAFRAWNIEEYLPRITCPVLLIQGRDDEYGTLAQLDRIERQVKGPVERVVIEDCRHAPQRDQPEATLAAITRFVRSCS